MTEKKFNVAVVGATGLVGRTMLSILEERNFPVDKVYALASSRSAGTPIKFKNGIPYNIDINTLQKYVKTFQKSGQGPIIFFLNFDKF